MTKFLMTMVVTAGMCGGVAGCEAKSAEHAGETAQADGKAKQPATTPAAAPAPAAEPSKVAPENLNQDTSDGAFQLFINALRAGDFRRMADLTDPASEAYEDFVKMAEQLDPATANPSTPKEALEFVRSMFSTPWKTATAEKVSEGEGRAKFLVTFGTVDANDPNAKPVTREVDLNQFQGVWRVLATNDLLRPPAPPKIPTNLPASTPPAAPAGAN